MASVMVIQGRRLDESDMGPKHRSARHHAGGVEQVRRMWGDPAARAAEIHIRRDCGTVPTEAEAQMVALFGATGAKRRP